MRDTPLARVLQRPTKNGEAIIEPPEVETFTPSFHLEAKNLFIAIKTQVDKFIPEKLDSRQKIIHGITISLFIRHKPILLQYLPRGFDKLAPLNHKKIALDFLESFGSEIQYKL